MFNCFLILLFSSCCFSAGKNVMVKNFQEYKPEAEEWKQWVLQVMMGNRSEIKLKTKHQMAAKLFPPALTSWNVFLWNIFGKT